MRGGCGRRWRRPQQQCLLPASSYFGGDACERCPMPHAWQRHGWQPDAMLSRARAQRAGQGSACRPFAISSCPGPLSTRQRPPCHPRLPGPPATSVRFRHQDHLPRQAPATFPPPLRRFFGNFGFGFGGEQQEEQTPKGNNVIVDLEVSLKDLYLGNQFRVGACCPDLNLARQLGLQHARS